MQPVGPLRPSRPVAPFAKRLLAADFPDLPVHRRNEVVRFVCSRVDILPSFTRFGVIVLALVFGAIIRLPFGWKIARLLFALPLPFVPEYPRLVRSLSVAYIWEHWPDTSPTGAARPSGAEAA